MFSNDSGGDLLLNLLGRHARVTVDDPEIRPLIRMLLQPFRAGDLEPTADSTIGITKGDGQWVIALNDGVYGATSDLWKALVDVRNAVVEVALADRTDLMPLHAAAVVREGRALLLGGRPWAGKTTFSFRFLEDGWQYFSDDLAPIRIETGEVLAFPKPPAIRTRPWAELKHLWHPEEKWLPPPTEYFVVPAMNLALAPYEVASPAWFIHLEFRSGARARLEEVTPASSFVRLLRGPRSVSPDQIKRLILIWQSARSVELTYDDVDEGWEILREYLAGW